jgi:exonuclease VII small subunit
MADHNKHHALELAELAKKLKEQGKTEAAEQLDKAVSEFESGNIRLNVALSLLKK